MGINIHITKPNLIVALDRVKFGKKALVYKFEEEKCITVHDGNERVIAWVNQTGSYKPTIYGMKLIYNVKADKNDKNRKKGPGKVSNNTGTRGSNQSVNDANQRLGNRDVGKSRRTPRRSPK